MYRTSHSGTGAACGRQYRTRQLRRRIFMFLAGLTLLVFLGVFARSSISSEAGTVPGDGCLGYRSVVVTRGQSMWDIAAQNREAAYYPDTASYLDAMLAMNRRGLQNDLHPGDIVLVPCHSRLR